MEQLQLPYEEIKDVANREFLRKNFKQTGRASYYIKAGEISERDGFNNRIVYEEIKELSQSILKHGLKSPLVLDILPDGKAFIDEGHRRIRAINMLIESNEPGWTNETPVEFFANKNTVTELDRVVSQFTTNNFKKKLKPYEAASVAYEIKHNFSVAPKTNEEVASLLGVSRQQVDNYISIASCSDQLRNEMVMADMNLTECITLIRNKKKNDKQADKKEEESHKSSSAATPLPKDLLADEVAGLDRLNKETGELETIFELPDDETRISHHNPTSDENNQPLDLVGNTVGIKYEKAGKEDYDGVKYDMDRVEIQQIQNSIKLADKLEAIIDRLDVPDGTKKDVSDIVKWLQKDLAEIRTWIHANKKQNKIR